MRYYLKQRGRIWYINWTDRGGCSHSRSTRTSDYAGAQDEKARFILERGGELTDSDPRVVTAQAVLTAYWIAHGRTRFAKDTIKTAIGVVNDSWAGVAVADLTIARQEALRDELLASGVSISTARRYMTAIWTALRWAVQRQTLTGHPPLIRFELPRAQGTKPAGLADLAALFAAATEERDRRWLVLAVTTLARPGALLDLTWDRVDLDSGLIDFAVPGRRETKKRRPVVPLCPTGVAYLKARRSVGPVIQYRGRALGDFRKCWERLSAGMGVGKGLTAYSVRKGIATLLRQRGLSPWDVQGMLGHRATGGVTEGYAQWDPAAAARVGAAIEGIVGEVRPHWLDSPPTVACETMPSGAPKLRIII